MLGEMWAVEGPNGGTRGEGGLVKSNPPHERKQGANSSTRKH